MDQIVGLKLVAIADRLSLDRRYRSSADETNALLEVLQYRLDRPPDDAACRDRRRRAVGWSILAPQPSNPGAANGQEQTAFKKKLADILEKIRLNHPRVQIDPFATAEHRLGLKPVIRRVWAPVGQRPIALGHHRFDGFPPPRSSRPQAAGR